MIYKNSQGKMIGKLTKNTFKKTVKESRHLFRATDSWGIQDSVFQELPENCRIEILDKENGILYSTTKAEWKANAEYLEFKDYGLQTYLCRDFFKAEKVQ
jgi:hypothetical protein